MQRLVSTRRLLAAQLQQRRALSTNATSAAVSPRIEDVRVCDVPIVSHEALSSNADLSREIEAAYGPDGMGILAVAAVPSLTSLRQALLPLAFEFATRVPDDVKEKYVLPEAFYSFGWSHGKEILQGKPDLSKGSFYNNPQYNDPVNSDQSLISKYPAFCHPNIWPTEVPEMESAFMNLGQEMVRTGLLVAAQCDTYVSKQLATYKSNKLHQIIKTSRSCKGRLLHYYALSKDQVAINNNDNTNTSLEMEFSNWCGWHNDHGSLTGLVQAMFMDDKTGAELKTLSDPTSGLYVKNRAGEILKANIPAGHLVYQIGEAAEIHSGGLLQATPHAVKGPRVPGVHRETFAVFMEPDWDEPMVNPRQRSLTSMGNNLPHGVPPLNSRWTNGDSFAEFTDKTLSAYY